MKRKAEKITKSVPHQEHLNSSSFFSYEDLESLLFPLIKETDIILENECGIDPILTHIINHTGELHAIDSSETIINYLKNKHANIQFKTNLSEYQSNSFNLIIDRNACNNILTSTTYTQKQQIYHMKKLFKNVIDLLHSTIISYFILICYIHPHSGEF